MSEIESSRTPIIDIVEGIAEWIAIQSHLWELYLNINHEVEENVNDDNENSTNIIAERMDELTELKFKYEEAYKMRKGLMRILRERYDANMDYRCLVKHSIATYQYTKELWDTERDNLDYEEMYIQASQFMYSILSRFLWVEIVKCWRCLLDAVEKENG